VRAAAPHACAFSIAASHSGGSDAARCARRCSGDACCVRAVRRLRHAVRRPPDQLRVPGGVRGGAAGGAGLVQRRNVPRGAAAVTGQAHPPPKGRTRHAARLVAAARLAALFAPRRRFTVVGVELRLSNTATCSRMQYPAEGSGVAPTRTPELHMLPYVGAPVAAGVRDDSSGPPGFDCSALALVLLPKALAPQGFRPAHCAPAATPRRRRAARRAPTRAAAACRAE
jgi:hypothetical protein